MHEPQKLPQGWILQPSRSPMREMPLMLPELPPHLGGEISVRTKVLSGCAIHYADVRRRPLAPIVGAVKAGLSEIYQAVPVPYWPATAILRVYGIWQSLRSSAFPRDLLWKIDTASAAHREALAKSLRDQSRPDDRGCMGKRVDLCKGLQYWDPVEQYNAIRSRLRFEKSMESRRWLIEDRMGPPEQVALHWSASEENDARRSNLILRRPALWNSRYGARCLSDGWETLPGPASDPEGTL